MTQIAETPRLLIRELEIEDAPFMLEILNDPAFIRYIGDRGVRTEEEARTYLRNGALDSYARHGYGIWLVSVKGQPGSAGICGLLNRETLPEPDLGFAFLPEFRSKGYASEAGAAVMAEGRRRFGMERIVAIVSNDNDGSIKVLRKLGFEFERMIVMPGETEEISLFVSE